MNISTSINQSSSLLRSPVNLIELFIWTSHAPTIKGGGASIICPGPGVEGGPSREGPPGGGGGAGSGGAGSGAARGPVEVPVGCIPVMFVWIVVWMADIVIKGIRVVGVIGVERIIILK